MTNEFSNFSIEELESKRKRTGKRQVFIMIFSGVVALVLGIAGLLKNNNEVLQMIPFLATTGIVMPYFIFNPIKKKIQKEINSRENPGV